MRSKRGCGCDHGRRDRSTYHGCLGGALLPAAKSVTVSPRDPLQPRLIPHEHPRLASVHGCLSPNPEGDWLRVSTHRWHQPLYEVSSRVSVEGPLMGTLALHRDSDTCGLGNRFWVCGRLQLGSYPHGEGAPSKREK